MVSQTHFPHYLLTCWCTRLRHAWLSSCVDKNVTRRRRGFN